MDLREAQGFLQTGYEGGVMGAALVPASPLTTLLPQAPRWAWVWQQA